MQTESISKPKTGRLDSLTTIRFLGAVYVALGHWLYEIPVISHKSTLWHFVLFARCSVSGFFLLSGFILAWVYLRDGKSINKRQFYVSRFARIYPLFLLTVVADIPIFFWSHIANYGVRGTLIKTGISFVSCLFMLQAWGRRFWGLNRPCWSLSAETFFYALFPFLGVLLWRLRRQWTWPAMVLVYVSGQLLVLAAVKVVGRYPIDPEFLLFLPPLHVSTFFLGVLLAKLRVDADKKQRASGRRGWTSYALFLTVGISFVILGLALPTSVTDSPTGQALLEDGVFSPFFCALIWALCDSKTIISRLLTMKWPLLLGEASYGLYLIHDPVLHLVVPQLVHVFSNASWREFRILYLLSFLVYLVVCIALSVASYLWFEGPSRRWIRSRFGSRPREAGTLITPDDLALGNSDLRPFNSTSN